MPVLQHEHLPGFPARTRVQGAHGNSPHTSHRDVVTLASWAKQACSHEMPSGPPHKDEAHSSPGPGPVVHLGCAPAPQVGNAPRTTTPSLGAGGSQSRRGAPNVVVAVLPTRDPVRTRWRWPRHGWNQGHCTSACGCCIRTMGHPEGEMDKRRDIRDFPFDIVSNETRYSGRMLGAYIFGLTFLE